MSTNGTYRVIISGGGTGGHIFPAISIANEIKARYPEAEILFVGALGRMEMMRVPEAGYDIIGLDIQGIRRKLTASNLLVPFKLLFSVLKARRILKKFNPSVVVGTGGFASGPLMMAASRRRIPSLVQEQNSYAGLTNKQLGSYAHRICVAYNGMERFFPTPKIRLTGNPVRKDILNITSKRGTALKEFGFSSSYRTLLILGGSLGARSINLGILNGIDRLIDAQVQVIWQTGKAYYEGVRSKITGKDLRRIRVFDFVNKMDMAYAAADVVISRAGALAISEICVTGKPCILVPSPNVAEDHQTKNAMALVKEQAAAMVRDDKSLEGLVSEAISLLFDEDKCAALSANVSKLARPEATEKIVNEIESLLKQ